MRLPLGAPFERNAIPLLIAHIDTDVSVPYKTAQQAFTDSASPKWFLTFKTGIQVLVLDAVQEASAVMAEHVEGDDAE